MKGGKKIIFIEVKGKNNVFEKREVTVKPLQTGESIVLSGLSPGEDVVVEGTFLLRSESNRGSLEED